MPPRAGNVTQPDPGRERRMRLAQRRLSKATAEAASAQYQRDQLIVELFDQRGYTQRLLSELLTTEAIETVGESASVSTDAVQKVLLRRTRRK